LRAFLLGAVLMTDRLFRTLRGRLLAIIVVEAIPALAVQVYSLHRQEEVEAEANRTLHTAAITQAFALDELFNRVIRVLVAVSHFQSVYMLDSLGTLAAFSALSKESPDYAEIAVFLPNGQLLAGNTHFRDDDDENEDKKAAHSF
jgi:hypothetical protein